MDWGFGGAEAGWKSGAGVLSSWFTRFGVRHGFGPLDWCEYQECRPCSDAFSRLMTSAGLTQIF